MLCTGERVTPRPLTFLLRSSARRDFATLLAQQTKLVKRPQVAVPTLARDL